MTKWGDINMDYIFFSGYYDFAAFILISSILFLIIRGIIRAIIKVIKYLASIPKKIKQEEELRQIEEKKRAAEEEHYYYKHVSELVNAYLNASSFEEKKALTKQLSDFMKEKPK